MLEVRELIKEASGKDKTVLLSTHIMQEVEALCSRAIIINQGTIVGDLVLNQYDDSTNMEEIFKSLTK